MTSDDQPQETMLQVTGGRLHVREIGTGTPLLVLHGGPDFNHHYLTPQLDRLADVFRLVYYDQRGRGKSSPGVVPEGVTMDPRSTTSSGSASSWARTGWRYSGTHGAACSRSSGPPAIAGTLPIWCS